VSDVGEVVFSEPCALELTPYQRTFIARRALKALEGSLDYREHIFDRYGDQANPVQLDGRIASLRGLLIKLGIQVEELPE
jgi:hypothetical protein